ncbi:LysR family transcriptional regulator [Pusillimonas sp. SM2304]|uniref:LysR family transcriptional regulator n=1 Tax=Pusillimonas sp. SM2304 TaxID=3073241 RepID=UPI002874BBEA|nr:LysR family transcriptional regulator [Pusillimonas sp. SM2304]MDS1141027.1 LysR family transcriptional regulator [Pusillimonas sp. SM2304]
MDLRFLQTFVHVAELGSISEAARFEDLTPASVQQRLRALDASVGSQLLRRAGRTVQPTVAGRRILDQARKILNDARDLRSMASDNELPAGPLHLGATPTALNSMVAGALKTWFAQHPDIEVYIEPGSSKALYARVLDGTLDAAILVHPQFDIPKHMAQQIIRHEPLVLVTPAGLNVADPLEALTRQPYICYDRSVLGGKLADDYLRERGLRPKTRLELDGIDAIGKLVSEGLGVSLLPDTGTLNEGPGGVKKWPLPAPVPLRSVAVFWARSGARAPLAQAFAQLLAPIAPQAD